MIKKNDLSKKSKTEENDQLIEAMIFQIIVKGKIHQFNKINPLIQLLNKIMKY